jgi:hypothetical protein
MGVAGEIVEKLMELKQKGEWTSITFNLTAGTEEAPHIVISLLPGTTEKNAKRIQKAFIQIGDRVNDGNNS